MLIIGMLIKKQLKKKLIYFQRQRKHKELINIFSFLKKEKINGILKNEKYSIKKIKN